MSRSKKQDMIEAEKFEMICRNPSPQKTTDSKEVPDYDDESGVYLGPGRAFDDEVLEYLSKDVEEQAVIQKKPTPSPGSPLKVDSVSGIYLGFDETFNENDEEDYNEGDATEEENPKASPEASSAQVWKRFKVKQSSKYKVSDAEEEMEQQLDGTNCFKFISKMWRKAEVCQ